MKTKISLFILLLSLFSFSQVSAEVVTVECSTNKVFAENACNQCFSETKAQAQGDTVGFLTDIWSNISTGKQILYKEEQKMPFMIDLNGTIWSQTPSAEGFWEYTTEFNALYDTKEEGYVLPAGQKITWQKSKLGSGYTAEKSTASAGQDIGLLVYPLKAHNILASGEVTVEDTEHRECVVFTAAAPKEVMTPPTPVTPGTPAVTPPKELPQTGPEHIILIALALILGFGLIMFTRKA